MAAEFTIATTPRSAPTPMTNKPARRCKTPPLPAPQAPVPQPPTAGGNRLRQAETRWQRTVRYAWDKGGSKGGR